MLLKSVLATGLMATAAVARVLEQRAVRRCGAPEPSEEILEMSKLFAKQEGAARKAGDVKLAATAVDVYVHVLASSNSVAGGYLSDATVQRQIGVLNADYASSGFSFVLRGTDRTINTAWAQNRDELAMKRALRKGDYSTLNLYFMPSVSGNLGYCYFPTRASQGSQDFILDGCTIVSSSVLGGSMANYNLGKTVTHEVGHWFGLYHTFQGGCTGAGDSVADTPAQSSATNGCPTRRDSCPNQAGLDPINNYMDYSYDSCMTEFTDGQRARMNSFWNNYRA